MPAKPLHSNQEGHEYCMAPMPGYDLATCRMSSGVGRSLPGVLGVSGVWVSVYWCYSGFEPDEFRVFGALDPPHLKSSIWDWAQTFRLRAFENGCGGLEDATVNRTPETFSL